MESTLVTHNSALISFSSTFVYILDWRPISHISICLEKNDIFSLIRERKLEPYQCVSWRLHEVRGHVTLADCVSASLILTFDPLVVGNSTWEPSCDRPGLVGELRDAYGLQWSWDGNLAACVCVCVCVCLCVCTCNAGVMSAPYNNTYTHTIPLGSCNTILSQNSLLFTIPYTRAYNVRTLKSIQCKSTDTM